MVKIILFVIKNNEKNIYSTSTTGENVAVVYAKKILKNTMKYLFWPANFNHFCLYASVLQMSVLGRVELKSFFCDKNSDS